MWWRVQAVRHLAVGERGEGSSAARRRPGSGTFPCSLLSIDQANTAGARGLCSARLVRVGRFGVVGCRDAGSEGECAH